MTTAPICRFTKPLKSEENHINIVLLGETGVGKSTFINAFSNYLQFESINDALDAQQLLCLITAKFTVNQDQVVVFEPQHQDNTDKNEDTKMGNSSTQSAKAYVFPLGDKNIRLIDTPGIGDARGVDQDAANFENILDFIGQFSHLHAICILLKPNVSVIQAYFKYCIGELLSRLHKSAGRNIVFVFTNTRGSNYMALESWTNIRSIMMEIGKKQKCFIPMKYTDMSDDNNVFCFDNEGFKFIVAQRQGIEFGNPANMEQSWQVSQAASWRLINYIIGKNGKAGLIPHKVQNTTSINESRRLIIELSKPLADISQLIQDNLTVLERHQAFILQENITMKQLQESLHIPTIDIRQTTLERPSTICTAKKCSKTYTVSGITKNHYLKPCHNPCYLSNVPKEIIGSVELLNCWAMQGQRFCSQCQCDFSTHMHIYYDTETIETTIEDSTVKLQMKSNEDILTAQYELVKSLQAKSQEYEKEHTIISKAVAKFAYFLKENSICPINDAYADYLDYLIGRENIIGGDKALKKRYMKMKQQHVEEVKLLETASAKCAPDAKQIEPGDVQKTIQQLYTLPKTGSKIRDLHKRQSISTTRESRNYREYVHPKVAAAPGKKEKAKEKKEKKVVETIEEKKDHADRVSELMRDGKLEEAFELLQSVKESEAKKRIEEEKKAAEDSKMEEMYKMLTTLLQEKIQEKNQNTNAASTSGTVPKQNRKKNKAKNNNANQFQNKPQPHRPQKWQHPNQHQQRAPQFGQNLRFPNVPVNNFNPGPPPAMFNNNFTRPRFAPPYMSNPGGAYNNMPGYNQNFQGFPPQPPFPMGGMNNAGYPSMPNVPQMQQNMPNDSLPQQTPHSFNINVSVSGDQNPKKYWQNKPMANTPADKYADPPPAYHSIPQNKLHHQQQKQGNAAQKKKVPPKFKKQTMHKQALQSEDDDVDSDESNASYGDYVHVAPKPSAKNQQMHDFLNQQRKKISDSLKKKEEEEARSNPPPVRSPTSPKEGKTGDKTDSMLKIMREMFMKR